MIRKHILAFGRVQGVGFRYFVYTKAVKYHLTGYAKNLLDGSVEIELQGKPDNIEDAIFEIRQGNNIINVNNLKINEINIIKEKDFYID